MCVLCRVINERTEDFVYEDEKAVVLISKFQTSNGHLIVTFKNHYENINDIAEEDYIHLQKLLKKYHEKLYKNFKPEKIYILLLAEEVSHIHFHLIPRYKGDTTGPKFLMEDIKEVADPNEIIRRLK